MNWSNLFNVAPLFGRTAEPRIKSEMFLSPGQVRETIIAHSFSERIKCWSNDMLSHVAFFFPFLGKTLPSFSFFSLLWGEKKNNSDKNSSKKIFQILMSWFGYCFWLRLFADQNISNPHIPYTIKKKEEIHFYLGNKAG